MNSGGEVESSLDSRTIVMKEKENWAIHDYLRQNEDRTFLFDTLEAGSLVRLFSNLYRLTCGHSSFTW